MTWHTVAYRARRKRSRDKRKQRRREEWHMRHRAALLEQAGMSEDEAAWLG